jgi:hypothetical protein
MLRERNVGDVLRMERMRACDTHSLVRLTGYVLQTGAQRLRR